MSISAELQALQQNTAALSTARTAIRTALGNKGVSASDHDFADFAGDIGNIVNKYGFVTKIDTISMELGGDE